jgi:hypothetical protein
LRNFFDRVYANAYAFYHVHDHDYHGYDHDDHLHPTHAHERFIFSGFVIYCFIHESGNENERVHRGNDFSIFFKKIVIIQ